MINLTGRYKVREIEVTPHAATDDGNFVVADDEYVLDVQPRQRGAMSTMTVFVASPTTAVQCTGITSKGTRCQRDAAEDSDYCALHEEDES